MKQPEVKQSFCPATVNVGDAFVLIAPHGAVSTVSGTLACQPVYDVPQFAVCMGVYRTYEKGSSYCFLLASGLMTTWYEDIINIYFIPAGSYAGVSV